ncbi:MAG: riboflavin biosynthesis protein RibF [Planctomycetota bacterium]|nr:riboflavin biosynthesis protein RibF [Planctomycetota bacterium]
MERHHIKAPEEAPILEGGSVVTVGVFDGVHLGHRSILDRLTATASKRALPSACITFAVHPRSVLSANSPQSLLSLEHRLELLERLGLNHAVIIEFSEDFSRIEPEVFVDEILVRRLGAKELIIGHDTAIGHHRRGNAAFLESCAQQHGFHIVTVGGVAVDGQIVSSTGIRAAMSRGDLDAAQRMLGRPVSLLGTVVEGAGRGAKIGFPTANLEVHSEAFPPFGVYAVTARFPDESSPDLPSVMNFGTRPTFNQNESHGVFEVHVLDQENLDLYGKRIEIFLHAFLRREHRFAGPEELVTQIRKDCEEARTVHRSLPAH